MEYLLNILIDQSIYHANVDTIDVYKKGAAAQSSYKTV